MINELIRRTFGRVICKRKAESDWLFLFTARPFDADTGLQNNLNRWYDARVGRWLSEDPIGFAAGDANLYRYVGNSVMIRVDPAGLGLFAVIMSNATTGKTVNVYFYDAECCIENGLTRAELTTIAHAVRDTCERIQRTLYLIDRYLPTLKIIYPPTNLPFSIGAIVNGPSERLKRFRDSVARCASKCNDQKIEFRCKVGGICAGRDAPFVTLFDILGRPCSEMLVCADNRASTDYSWAVLHEMGRWCGYQFYGGNVPPGDPARTIEYWDWVISNLGSSEVYQDIITRGRSGR